MLFQKKLLPIKKRRRHPLPQRYIGKADRLVPAAIL